jgi:D-alanine transaminase
MALYYVNGSFIPADQAVVPMEDRGHQFGDGVYEVIAFFNRKMVDLVPHLERLERSLREVRIPQTYSLAEIITLLEELIQRNEYEHGGVYLQITRGAAKRDHSFTAAMKPALTLSVFGQKTPAPELVASGCKVITQPDLRWKRCDIKTICLLPNILAKQAATDAGMREALLVKDNGEISEGSVSNAFAVIGGKIITHQPNNEILNGITRMTVLGLARKLGITIEERPFTLDELLHQAEEAFLTGTTTNVLPISFVDGRPIGAGVAGKIALRLNEAYLDFITEQTGYKHTGANQ